MTNIMSKIAKVLIILLILQFIFAVENISEATSWKDIFEKGDSFLQEGKDHASSGSITTDAGVDIGLPNDTNVKNVVQDVYTMLFALGVGVIFIVGIILGIKFMMASTEEKANLKEMLIPYFIGSVVIFAAFGIWKLAITIFSSLS